MCRRADLAGRANRAAPFITLAKIVRGVLRERQLTCCSPSAVACGSGQSPCPVVLRRYPCGVAPHRSACGIALVLQCDRPRAGDRRKLRVWRPRHHAVLSPVTHPSRPGLSEMAGVRFRNSRRMLHAGYAGALGGGAPTPSRACRPPGRSAQSAGRFLLGSCRLDAGEKHRSNAAQHLRSGTQRTFCAIRSIAGWNAPIFTQRSSSHPGSSSLSPDSRPEC